MYYKAFGGRKGPPRFRRTNKKPRFSGSNIDASRFVKKAMVVEKAQEFVPEHGFADFAIEEKLKLNIRSKGYTQPTPIQDKTIPLILQGKDVVGIANTGTGKTAAFLIPLLNKVIRDRSQKVLIMAPTRELAMQINQEFMYFVRGFGIYSVPCIGGASIRNQIVALRRTQNFIIGTPGRIKDLVDRKMINLSQFKNVVLDEADRMLDMGFIHDIKLLLSMLSKDRHSLFFSATISPQIQELIKTFLRDPVTVSVKIRETAANVDQDVVRVQPSQNKLQVLQELLGKKEFEKVLIFGRTKHGVEKLSTNLAQKGFRAVSIHGNKTQSKRQTALKLFKENKVQILVATDVAARGLDIPNVSHVINFDVPATYDDYVHRIGRTGRADQKGIALTFVD